MSEQRSISPSENQKIDSDKKLAPWKPNQIFSYVFIVTTIGVGIILGINWKRLRKPEWQVKTILLSIIVPALAIPLALGWILAFGTSQNLPIQIVLIVPMLALGANFGYLWALARLQEGAYKAYEARGLEALSSYKYDLKGAVIFGINVAVIAGIVGTFIFPLLEGR